MKNLSKNILKIKNKKRKMKNTGKHRGGQAPLQKNPLALPKNNTDELGPALVNGYISILQFIKNKLARFAGLKPVQEEISSGPPGPSLAEQGAETAINILNTSLQNPNIKSGVAFAAGKLATTLGDVAKVAKEKLDDPEFQETLLLLVKFLAEMTTKFLDAISDPLNRSIDKYTATFERLIRKMATALANAIMDFMKGLPFLGQAVAFISLLHTISMLIFSFIEAFYKTLNTTANFVAQVSDNLNSSGSTDGISKLKNLLQPSINKYTDIAKSKYEDLKTEALQPTITDIPVDANQMKAIKGGRKRTQKRIQKTFRDYYKTNKTRRTRRH